MVHATQTSLLKQETVHVFLASLPLSLFSKAATWSQPTFLDGVHYE